MPRTKKQPRPSTKKAPGAKSTKVPRVTVADLQSKGDGSAPHHRVIRVASVTNPKTEKAVLVRVTTDGHVTDPRLAKRLKVTKALSSWREVEAETWKAATAAFRAGKGTPVSAK